MVLFKSNLRTHRYPSRKSKALWSVIATALSLFSVAVGYIRVPDEQLLRPLPEDVASQAVYRTTSTSAF